MSFLEFLKKNLFKSVAVVLVAMLFGFAYLQGEENSSPAPTPTVSPTPHPSAAFIPALPTEEPVGTASPSPADVAETATPMPEAVGMQEESPAEALPVFAMETPQEIPQETPAASPASATVSPEKTAVPMPLPTAMAAEEKKEPERICSLSVRCDTLLQNIDTLSPEKAALVPQNGVILALDSVSFEEGESVFNILRRETKRHGVHLEFVQIPLYGSAYIEGIHNLYEFDCGDGSGWMYRVNGIFPKFGCSLYTLSPGDKVDFVYTCNLGHDVGGGYAPRNGA